jgi:MerR family transcriptional regulator, copper efflux regulator
MQIGIFAKKIALSVDAIRFYERNALLPRPPRTHGGLRRYSESDVDTLAFIRRVQGLGFKLSEIRGLLNLRGNRLQPWARCDADWKISSLMCSGNLPTFRS